MNVTLSIDDQVVARARHLAATRGTSLNQLIRDYLEELTRPGDVQSVTRPARRRLVRRRRPFTGPLDARRGCMKGREFIDTNVLIYADDDRDPQKRDLARDLIRALLRGRRGVLSLQVLQEFFAAATRKLGMSGEEAKRRVVLYSRFDVVTLIPADLFAAIDLHRLHHLSIWDCLIVRAAMNGRCATLHTGDLSDGAVIESLTVSNPFAALGGNRP